MKTFIILLWIRWRLLLHKSDNDFLFPRTVSRALLVLVFVLFSIAFGLSFIFVLELIVQHSQGMERKVAWLQNANQLFLSVVLMVLVGKIISSGRILKHLDSRVMRFYPIGGLTVLSFNLIEGLIDRWYIALGSVMFGFMIGATFISNLAVIAPTLILILASIVALHLFVEVLEEFGEFFFSLPTEWKYAIPVVAILAVLPLFNGSVSSLRTLLSAIILYSPIGWMNQTVYALAFEGDLGVVLKSMFYASIATFLSFLILLTMYQLRMNTPFERLTNPISKKRRTHRAPLGKLVFLLLPGGITPYALKDLRYLLRSRRTLLMFLVELGWLVYVSYYFGWNETVPLRPSIMVFFLSFFPVVFWESYLANSYGMEKSAFGSYLSMPTVGRNIVLAKNLSFLLIKAPFILISWVVFLSFFSLPLLPFLIVAQLVTLCLSIISGNVNSLRYPYPAERNGKLLSPSPSNSFSLLGFVVLTLSLVIPVAIGLMLWMLGAVMGAYALLFIFFIVVLYIYRKTLPKASKMFTERGELIYHILARQ